MQHFAMQVKQRLYFLTPNFKQKGITGASGDSLFSHKLSRKILQLKQNTEIIAANTGFGGCHIQGD